MSVRARAPFLLELPRAANSKKSQTTWKLGETPCGSRLVRESARKNCRHYTATALGGEQRRNVRSACHTHAAGRSIGAAPPRSAASCAACGCDCVSSLSRKAIVAVDQVGSTARRRLGAGSGSTRAHASRAGRGPRCSRCSPASSVRTRARDGSARAGARRHRTETARSASRHATKGSARQPQRKPELMSISATGASAALVHCTTSSRIGANGHAKLAILARA